MTIETELARLTAGLAQDERIARAAIGKRGREAGAVVQHWQWEQLVGDDDIVLTDGSSPIDATYCYAEEIDRDKVDGPAILLTAERYLARVADWQLQDQLLPGVQEPHAGAAQHIARHDPARVLRQVDAIREIVGLHRLTSDPELGKLGELDRLRIEVQQTTLESVITTLAGIYTEPTKKPEGTVS